MARLQSGTRIYGNATIDTVLSIGGNNTSSSSGTGALVVAGGIGVSGNVYSTGNITAINATLGNLIVANYVTGTLITPAQPNITSVGTLGNLAVTGNSTTGNLTVANGFITTDATINGNLVVNGNAIYANTITLNVKDPIIEQGGDPIGSPLSTNDQRDRGQLLHYYSDSPVDAFMGWKNANGEFIFASNASSANNIITVNTYGNVRADNFIGKLEGTAKTSLTVTNNAQPNITSVGTLTDLTVSGNLEATITTASQPNITSLGTLTGLLVNGITGLGNIGNVKILGGAPNYIMKTDGTGNLTWATQTTVSGSNTNVQFNDSGNLGSSANFTFDNTTETLTVTNIAANTLSVPSISSTTANLGAIGNLTITGGFNGQAVITDGNGHLTFGSVSAGASGNNKSVQYNVNGIAAGSDSFAFDAASNTVSINGNLALNSSSPVQFKDSTNTNHVSLQAPANIPASVNYTLPSTDGSLGNVLATDGNGGLYWRGAPTQTLSIGTRSGQSKILTAMNSLLIVVGRSSNVAVPIA